MVVDGVELLRMIRDDEIKICQHIKGLADDNEYYYDGTNITNLTDYKNLLASIPDIVFVKSRFEILSDENEEIDIQAIEEIKQPNNNIAGISYAQEKINELIKAVKQLDKKIK